MFSERIKFLRKELGLTQREFAERIGLNYMSISRYERGSMNVASDILHRIGDVFNVNMNWLFYGKESPFQSSTSTTAIGEQKGLSGYIRHSSNKEGFHISVDMDSYIKENQIELADRLSMEHVLISQSPIYSAAGSAVEILSEPEADMVKFPKELIKGKGPFISLEIRGESMQPTIPDGYIGIYDTGFPRDFNALNGYIVLAKHIDSYGYQNGICTKRFIVDHENERCLLRSDNPDKDQYPDLLLTDCFHIEQVVLGRLALALKEFPNIEEAPANDRK